MAPWSAQPQTMLLNLSFSSVDSWNPTSSKPTSQTFKKKKQWGWESGEAVALLYLFAIGSRFLFFFFFQLSLFGFSHYWLDWLDSDLWFRKNWPSLHPQSTPSSEWIIFTHVPWFLSALRVLPPLVEPGEHHLGSPGSILFMQRKFMISSGFNLLFLII